MMGKNPKNKDNDRVQSRQGGIKSNSKVKCQMIFGIWICFLLPLMLHEKPVECVDATARVIVSNSGELQRKRLFAQVHSVDFQNTEWHC